MKKRESFLLRVTEEDAGDGYPGHCFTCPTALALNRTFSTKHSFVGELESHVWLSDVQRKITVTLGDELRTEISALDNLARAFRPGLYEVFL